MYHTQENIIFCSTYTIFDKKFFPKYTKSCVKGYKPALVSILYISISPIQNNSPCFLSLSLSYKSPSLLPLLVSKKPIVKVEEIDNKVLNQVDLSIKLRYFLEKEIFMEYPTNILQSFLWQSKGRIPNSNIIYDIHENTCQKSQRIYQNAQR